MAPSRRKPRRNLNKKQLDQSPTKETCSQVKFEASSPPKFSGDSGKKMEEHSMDAGCTTPKAQRYQIPELLTCPPAPKKRRLVSSCTLRRSPIAFFDPPDIELFFASHLAAIYQSKFSLHTHVR